MRRSIVLVAVVLLATPVHAADPYRLKVVEATPAPEQVAEPVRKLLTERCVQFLDAQGGLLVELWFRKEVPAKATPAQVSNGLTYDEVPETTLLGVIRVARATTDYRKQPLPEGVYTLRLAFQPKTGDHAGTAPHTEFCLLTAAAEDKSPALLTQRALITASARINSAHPTVLLLFPGTGAAAPKLVDKGEGHWVLLFKQEAIVDGKPASIGIALTLVGVSPSA
jgi:hypothetical protein